MFLSLIILVCSMCMYMYIIFSIIVIKIKLHSINAKLNDLTVNGPNLPKPCLTNPANQWLSHAIFQTKKKDQEVGHFWAFLWIYQTWIFHSPYLQSNKICTFTLNTIQSLLITAFELKPNRSDRVLCQMLMRQQIHVQWNTQCKHNVHLLCVGGHISLATWLFQLLDCIFIFTFCCNILFIYTSLAHSYC